MTKLSSTSPFTCNSNTVGPNAAKNPTVSDLGKLALKTDVDANSNTLNYRKQDSKWPNSACDKSVQLSTR